MQFQIRRRIIVTTVTVAKQGEQKVVEITIPDNVNTIVGVMTTSSFRSGNPIQTTKRYFGKAATGLNNPLGLQSEHISNKGKVFQIQSGANEKVYYFHPVRLGRPDFSINGILGGFQQPTIVSVTDPDTGFTEDYYGFESQQSNLGNINVAVKW